MLGNIYIIQKKVYITMPLIWRKNSHGAIKKMGYPLIFGAGPVAGI